MGNRATLGRPAARLTRLDVLPGGPGNSPGRQTAVKNNTTSGNKGRKIGSFSDTAEFRRALHRHVLSRYPSTGAIHGVEPITATTGFSGARLWRVVAEDHALCLRVWPTDFHDQARLAWIHTNLRRIAVRDFKRVPMPLTTVDRETWVAWSGRLWELAPWLPGRADYRHRATRARLESALRALAELHAAAVDRRAEARSTTSSPALRRRRDRFLQIDARHLDALQRALEDDLLVQRTWPGFPGQASSVLAAYRHWAPAVSEQVRKALTTRVPLQVCHGDAWHDHFLFTDDRLTGIVDFGNMQVESRAIDIARLLGSLARDDASAWGAGLAAYDQAAPLIDAERALIKVLDESSVLLSGMNWLKWLLLEHRQFESLPRVSERLDEICERLRFLGQRPVADG